MRSSTTVPVCLLAAMVCGGRTHGQSWTWTTLDYPGVSPTVAGTGTWACGVSGQNVVGYYSDGSTNHGFLYDGTTWTSLDYPGATYTQAYGIDGNRIVGTYLDANYISHGFVYNSVDTTWPPLDYSQPGRTTLRAVSGNRIVGIYQNSSLTQTYGIVYDGSSWTSLQYPNSDTTQACGISGDKIVGLYTGPGTWSYTYDGTTWTKLGQAGYAALTIARGIDGNNIVGYFTPQFKYPPADTYGFLYDGTKYTSLHCPSAGQFGTWASDMSGNRIAGYYYDGNGRLHGFLLTVPEPTTLCLLALGGLLLAWRRAARVLPILLAAGLLAGSTNPAPADVFDMGGTRNPATGQWTGLASVEFVTIGDPGNAGDTLEMASSPYASGFGAVGYTYQMGKYDVTAGQYCQFLNAVARTDAYGLYSPYMAPANNLPTRYGGAPTFGITRSGSPGSYTYSVTGNPNFPVNYVSWGSAARFCNWLSNGQPTGAQDSGTTETGSYILSGTEQFYNPDGTIKNQFHLGMALMAVTRNAGAQYVIPTENEWYKAAYYRGGSVNAGYWMFPTQSDNWPSNVLSGMSTNNANYWGWNGTTMVYTDPANYLTAVGSFAGSPGPYGTFDMGGNVFQWNETNISGAYRGVRGGSFAGSGGSWMKASYFNGYGPWGGSEDVGFRIALVPEPATLSLLALSGLLIARRRRGY